jgi:hypothetical protein
MVTRKTAPKKVARKAPARKVGARSPALQKAEAAAVVEIVEVVLPVVLAAADKPKLVRDSFTMPKAEYELLAALKARLLVLSKAAKKSELLRAGVVLLSTLSDADLLSAVDRVPSLKTGRPKKAKDAKK